MVDETAVTEKFQMLAGRLDERGLRLWAALPLQLKPLERDSADRAMDTLVDLVAPAVELQLEVGLVREPPAGLEIRAHEPVRPLQHTLG